MEQTMNLPEDDTYAKFAFIATEMTSKPIKGSDSQSESEEMPPSNKSRKAVATYNKRLYCRISMYNDTDTVVVNGKEYKVVLKDHNKKTGFQAIVFKHPDKDAYILAVGGSYSAKKVFSNPREWFND